MKNTPEFPSLVLGPGRKPNIVRDLVLPEPVNGAMWIPLTKGHFVLVDEEDYPVYSQFNWSASVLPRTVYAYLRRNHEGKSRILFLHRVITGAPHGMQVDHINGNGLDCRRSNLRVCTVRANHQNIRKTVVSTSSQYKGVSWDKCRSKWLAKVKAGGRYFNVGRFDDEEDAARAYDTKARDLFGEFARLNFPDEVQSGPLPPNILRQTELVAV